MKSSELLIAFGLPSATARVSVFEANISVSPASRSSDFRVFIVFSSAVATTSAGAPSEIWETRSEEPAKENFTSGAFSSAALNSSAMSSKTSVSEAAAKTVISVGSSASAPESGPEEQAVRVRAATVQSPRRVFFMDLLNPQMRFCVDLSSDYETRNGL